LDGTKLDAIDGRARSERESEIGGSISLNRGRVRGNRNQRQARILGDNTCLDVVLHIEPSDNDCRGSLAKLYFDVRWIRQSGRDLVAEQIPESAAEPVDEFLDCTLCRAQALSGLLVSHLGLAASQIAFELPVFGIATCLHELVPETSHGAFQDSESPMALEERFGIEGVERFVRVCRFGLPGVDRQQRSPAAPFERTRPVTLLRQEVSG
jgi:hypothetical protein